MLPLIGLIPLLPLLGFLVCGIVGRRLPKGAVATVACGSVLLAFLVSLGAVLELRGRTAEEGGARAYERSYWIWLPSMPLQEGPDDRISLTHHDDGTEVGSSPAEA